jgi:hypothetical protein
MVPVRACSRLMARNSSRAFVSMIDCTSATYSL